MTATPQNFGDKMFLVVDDERESLMAGNSLYAIDR